MKRMKLRRKKIKKVDIVIIIIIFLIISIIYILNIFNKKALPIFLEYSELEVKRVATLIINNSIMNGVGKDITITDLFVIKEDNNGNIISMDVDPAKTNELLLKTSEVLERNFKYVESGEIDKLKIEGLNINNKKKGVIYELPSGIIFNNIFLNNLFPKIPVRLNLAGTVFSKLTTDVESYGINNAIFKVNLFVSTELKVVLPFTSKNIYLETTIPIIIKIIEGDVPNYYFGNK